jgi:hypothetical protein
MRKINHASAYAAAKDFIESMLSLASRSMPGA